MRWSCARIPSHLPYDWAKPQLEGSVMKTVRSDTQRGHLPRTEGQEVRREEEWDASQSTCLFIHKHSICCSLTLNYLFKNFKNTFYF